MVTVLVFHPKPDDLAMIYAGAWIDEVAGIMAGYGHEVHSLTGEYATQQNLLEMLDSLKPTYVFCAGHGRSNQFYSSLLDPAKPDGQRELVFSACENDGAMNGTEAMFLSCLMGIELGVSMHNKGAKVVAAYTGEFSWVVTPGYEDNPSDDPRAYPFRRIVVEPIKILAAGGTWREWYNRTVTLCNEGIREWWGSLDPSAPEICKFLAQNRDYLVLYGAETVPVEPPTLTFPIASAVLIPAALGIVLLCGFTK